MKSFWRLLREIKSSSTWLTLSMLALLLSVLSTQGVNLMMGRLLDTAISTGVPSLLGSVLPLVALVSLSIISLALDHLFSGYFNVTSQSTLRTKTFKSLGRLSMATLSSLRTGDILNRFNDDLAQLESAVNSLVKHTLATVIQMAIVLVIAIKIRWELALIAIGLPIAYNMLFLRVSRPIQHEQQTERELAAEVTSQFEDILGGWVEIKSFNLVERMNQKLGEQMEKHSAKMLQVSRFWSVISSCDFLMSQGYPVLIVLLASFYIQRGQMSIGQLFVFLRITPVFLNFIWDLDPHSFRTSITVAERLFSLWDEPKERLEGESAPIDGAKPLVQFRNVQFSYPDSDQMACNGITFKLEQGKTLGIVGESGCGKTTILNLLCGFYEDYTGMISFGGTDIRMWRLDELRRHLAFVQQDPYLFPTTVSDNIVLGSNYPEEIKDKRLRESIARARLSDLMDSRHEGYHLAIRGNGENLSVGQRQRIALARAFYKEPMLVLLDEPTSALDAATESWIHDALKDLFEGRTAIVVSHRLNIVKGLDNIIVLDQGRIVEQGTHHKLLERKGKYYQMYMQQFSGLETG